MTDICDIRGCDRPSQWSLLIRRRNRAMSLDENHRFSGPHIYREFCSVEHLNEGIGKVQGDIKLAQDQVFS